MSFCEKLSAAWHWRLEYHSSLSLLEVEEVVETTCSETVDSREESEWLGGIVNHKEKYSKIGIGKFEDTNLYLSSSRTVEQSQGVNLVGLEAAHLQRGSKLERSRQRCSQISSLS